MDKRWLAVLRSKKAEWTQAYGLTRMAVFGSQARGDAMPDSDLDVLVDFRRPLNFDLLKFIGMEQELEEALSVPVDLVIEGDLKPIIREEVLREAVDL